MKRVTGLTAVMAKRTALRVTGQGEDDRSKLFGGTVLAAVSVALGSVPAATAQHGLPQDWFHLDAPHVVEGTPAVFTVRVPGNLAFAVRWRYHTEDASATAGSDYVGSQGTVQFNVGERVKTITVQTLTDDTVEGVIPEFFQLQLTDLEISTDGVTWERPGYIPHLLDDTATTGTIRDANVPLDVLNPPD